MCCLYYTVPNSPRNLTSVRVSNSSIYLKWLPPLNSLYSGYAIRYRTNDNETWTDLHIPDTQTDKEVKDLSPGEKYIIRVSAVSYKVESAPPLQVIQTTR